MYANDKTYQCIDKLKEIGISQDVINLCFVPEETTDELEVKGSVYMALQESGKYPSFIDCVEEGDRILNLVFGDGILDVRVKDYSKKKDMEEIMQDQ